MTNDSAKMQNMFGNEQSELIGKQFRLTEL